MARYSPHRFRLVREGMRGDAAAFMGEWPACIAPRKGFSPYYYGRGTYLGQFVNRSTGVDRAAIAKRVIKEWEREIERGRFDKAGPNFTDAAVALVSGPRSSSAVTVPMIVPKLVLSRCSILFAASTRSRALTML